MRYLKLARMHHPDAAASSAADEASKTATFARISAAYHSLSDPHRRAAADKALEDPTKLAAKVASEAILQCRAGRSGDGLALAEHALDIALSAANPARASAALAEPASTILELAARRGEPHHGPATRLWEALLEWNSVDSRACNAYFALALRGGHTRDAMRAIRHAEAHGLEQSAQMQSTARQVRRYKAKKGDSESVREK